MCTPVGRKRKRLNSSETEEDHQENLDGEGKNQKEGKKPKDAREPRKRLDGEGKQQKADDCVGETQIDDLSNYFDNVLKCMTPENKNISDAIQASGKALLDVRQKANDTSMVMIKVDSAKKRVTTIYADQESVCRLESNILPTCQLKTPPPNTRRPRAPIPRAPHKVKHRRNYGKTWSLRSKTRSPPPV